MKLLYDFAKSVDIPKGVVDGFLKERLAGATTLQDVINLDHNLQNHGSWISSFGDEFGDLIADTFIDYPGRRAVVDIESIVDCFVNRILDKDEDIPVDYSDFEKLSKESLKELAGEYPSSKKYFDALILIIDKKIGSICLDW